MLFRVILDDNSGEEPWEQEVQGDTAGEALMNANKILTELDGSDGEMTIRIQPAE